VDILVNNAGIAPFVGFAETSTTTFDEIVNVNVRSVFFLTQALLPRMREGGRIINLSSVVTRSHFAGVMAYSVLKGAIDVFTRHLATTAAGISPMASRASS
jgi:NAD(P)-dependent dehydrogenase (short-subunit alcohol dehydrogenase family)